MSISTMKAIPCSLEPRPRLRTFADLREFFTDNAAGFFAAHRMVLIILVVAAMADLATTIRFMLADGVHQEVHPVIRAVSVLFGPIMGPTIGKLGQVVGVLIIGILFRRHARIIIATVAFLYAWAAWYNIWGVHLYTPRIVSVFE